MSQNLFQFHGIINLYLRALYIMVQNLGSGVRLLGFES